MSDPVIYPVRLHPLVSDDIEEAQTWIKASLGEAYAEEWHEGLLNTLSTLATYPERCVLARENHLFQNDVRVFLFRYRSSSVTYRILYEIVLDDLEPSYVYVLHIRHGARKPITQAEARHIEQE